MKGMWMAGVAVLLREVPTAEAVERALAGRPIAKRVTSDTSGMGGLFGLVIPMRAEVNGNVVVDVLEGRWPDDMGDPRGDAKLFGAWSMGFYGPFAYPGGLERAASQAYAFPDARQAVDAHRAFVRVRASYVLGGSPDSAVAPPDYDAEAELRFVTEIAAALCKLPGALCYFNPNGEVLLDPAELDESLSHARKHGLSAIDAWTNVRMFGVDGVWTMMDTVGLGQLDEPDHEAWFERARIEPDAVARWLRNLSLYVHGGAKIEDGHTADGPGGVKWRAEKADEPATSPPRTVLRWTPADGPAPPWSPRAADVPQA